MIQIKQKIELLIEQYTGKLKGLASGNLMREIRDHTLGKNEGK